MTGEMHRDGGNAPRSGRRQPRAADEGRGGLRPGFGRDWRRCGWRPGVMLALAAGVACGAAPPEEPAADPAPAAPPPYHVYVTNEYSGDLTVIAGGTNEVVATVPLGQRPRGIKVSPDGTQLFVALSGSPPAPPGIDESTLPPPDRSADGIGVFDRAAGEVVQVVHAGTDPEQLAVSADGTRLYVANEDAGRGQRGRHRQRRGSGRAAGGRRARGSADQPRRQRRLRHVGGGQPGLGHRHRHQRGRGRVRGRRAPARLGLHAGREPRLRDGGERRHGARGRHRHARGDPTPSNSPARWCGRWVSSSRPTGPAST